MAIYRIEPHPVSVAWAASGSISLELSPKPYTITRLGIYLSVDISTTTVTNFNDYWDRIISTLTLSGSGKTYFGFSNMRIAYHMTRMRGVTTKRPTVVAGSATNNLTQIGYLFHFGVVQKRIDPKSGHVVDNPFDLSAGIPPAGAGNLTLTGSFGAAAAPGTNVTVNATADCALEVLLWGVQPEAGDPVEAWMPRAIPVWSQRTPTPSATSTPFATQDNIPAGDFLHSMLVMTTRGTNAPRLDDILRSIRVYNSLESRAITTYGGRVDRASQGSMVEIFSQSEHNGWPPTDDTSGVAGGTAANGVPAVVIHKDVGLHWFPLWKQANKALLGGLYGADLRHIATGDLQLHYGVGNATTVTMDVLYNKYQLNPLHPANAGL